jgi:acetyl-CoA carboxylase biotin carboxylase subunit
MFRKILIANRGEIALRIIWACRELGIRTVAIHSEPDKDSLHVRFADEDVCVGPARSTESYLNISSVITAAEITNAEAIHPGYGFLAESSTFAEVCKACRIKFIGPRPDVIASMGEKARARDLMKSAGVPVLPGSEGTVETLEEAAATARQIEYPVIVKAAAGGGGKGMRIAADEKDMNRVFSVAREEARAAFGVPDVYVEKYLPDPRHIEFQVMADEHGNMVHLGERECSIQRRHQKLVEESPSTALTPDLRKKMAAAAIKAAQAVGYQNAGTVEFLLQDGRFFFIEMNTRIQVEHPVTEMVTGVDLVKEQILIASGQKLSWKQGDIVQKGHSIECRINAEDPEQGFRPAPGRITRWQLPAAAGVRFDSHVEAGYLVPPHYDSLLCKAIATGASRDEACDRMIAALEAIEIEGVPTTIGLHLAILRSADFRAGRYDTRTIPGWAA